MKADLHRELELWGDGYYFIGGADEVGLASAAGPVVAAIVVISKGDYRKFGEINGINDSKKLSRSRREKLRPQIEEASTIYGIGCISNKIVDLSGLGYALNLAYLQAFIACRDYLDYLLVDGRKRISTIPSFIPQETITKGDLKCISIAAASILAKTFRDDYMRNICHSYFPQYGFNTNVGYATKYHKDMIKKHGMCIYHRKSYNIKL